MTRIYKLFKVTNDKEKLVKTFSTLQEATLKVRNIIGLREFQKCIYEPIFEGVSQMGIDFIRNGIKIFTIRKEIHEEFR